MKIFNYKLTMICSILLATTGLSSQVSAQILFSDDFEDRVKDQALIGNNWTWYDQWFAEEGCTGEAAGGWGPVDSADPNDYVAANRNFFTVPAGTDDYYRAGLEVPAWDGALTSMLRVYGNQYNTRASCQRTLIFQEMTAPKAGAYTFSFDVAQSQDGAPANGEVTAAFVKVLDPQNSYATVLFETVKTTPPVATSAEDVTTLSQMVEFNISDEMVGKLLQFGFYNDVTPSLGHSWGNAAALYDNIVVAPLEIGPAHSGSYFNTGQSGHGFSVEFGQLPDGQPLAVIYWYIYDDSGNPIFMVGTGVPDGNRVEIAFESPVGMIYGVFDPVPEPRENGGTAVFVFSDRNNATFSYTPSAFSETTWGHTTPIVDLPIVKLFDIPANKFFSVPSAE
jgi:hypothetical protein